ncbi:cache domain-containing protein, partial [Methyloparacoccus murrellii]
MTFPESLRWHNTSLARRLSLWFILLVMVPMLVTAILIDRKASNSLRDKTLLQLTMIAKDKASSLEIYAYERARGAGVLGRLKRLADATRALQDRQSTRETLAEARSRVRELVNYFGPSLGFSEAIVVDSRGEVMFQTLAHLELGANLLSGPQQSTPLASLTRRTLTLLEPDISDFALYPGNDIPLAFVAAPIIQEDGRKTGLIILQLNTEEIYGILSDYSGLGRTGNTIVGSLVQNTIWAAAPMRKRDEAAFQLSVDMGDDHAQDLQSAVKGDQGAGEVTNILRQRVYSSWVYVPSFRWGLTVEQSVDEAMALVAEQRKTLLALLAAILT